MLELTSVFFILSGVALYSKWVSPGAGLVFVIYFSVAVVYPGVAKREYDPYTESFVRFLDFESASMGFLILSFAFLVVYVSYFLFRTKLATSTLPSSAIVGDARACERLAMFSVVIGLAYIAFSAILFGSVSNAMLSAYKRVQATSSISNFRSILYWAAVVSSIFAFLISRNMKVSLWCRLLVYLAIIISLILSLSNGGRSVFILYLVALLFFVVVKANTRQLIILSGAFVGFVFLVSSAMIYARYSAQGAVAASEFDAVGYAFTGLRYLDHFVISMGYADWAGHDYGGLYGNAALSFIPRSLWEEKPQLISAGLRYYIYGDYTGGVPPGLFGEGYISFDVLGVMIVAFLYGWLLAKLDSYIPICVKTGDVRFLVLLGLFVPLVGFTFVRGGVDIGVFRLGIPFFWYVVISWYVGKTTTKRFLDVGVDK